MDTKLDFTIDPEIRDKIMHWVKKAGNDEVSGLGKAVVWGEGYYVTSAMLLDQENTSATTELEAAAVAKLLFKLKDEPGVLWWWHSHANMSVFWSTTDTDTIAEIAEGGICLATVFNAREQTKSALYRQATDDFPTMFINDIELLTDHPAIEPKEEWDKEYDENVKEKKWAWGGQNSLLNTPTYPNGSITYRNKNGILTTEPLSTYQKRQEDINYLDMLDAQDDIEDAKWDNQYNEGRIALPPPPTPEEKETLLNDDMPDDKLILDRDEYWDGAWWDLWGETCDDKSLRGDSNWAELNERANRAFETKYDFKAEDYGYGGVS